MDINTHLQFAEASVLEELSIYDDHSEAETLMDEYVTVVGNTVSFTIQDGARKVNGINGLQVTDVLCFIKNLYKSLNHAFPCRENSLAITKIEEAIHWQEARTKERISRSVEGEEIA